MWMADQSVEAWDKSEGCFEHMQDCHCRHSHVRVVESHDARAVVHWRYAPTSAYDHMWRVDEKTGWTCWVDEDYYIYPDATGVRFVSWKNDSLGQPRQFQESLPFTHPGQLPGEVVHADWVTIGNMKGEMGKLSFIENPPKVKVKPGLPSDLTIQVYNFKALNKPFIIFEAGNVMEYLWDRDIKALSRPGACDHWPVSQNPCDGRTAQTSDHPTHFLGFPISDPPVHEGDGRCWWHGLYGMTTRAFPDVARLARSWNQPPALSVSGGGATSLGYRKPERAYHVSCPPGGPTGAIDSELAASDASPAVNPAFVVRGWGEAQAEISVDGKRTPAGSDGARRLQPRPGRHRPRWCGSGWSRRRTCACGSTAAGRNRAGLYPRRQLMRRIHSSHRRLNSAIRWRSRTSPARLRVSQASAPRSYSSSYSGWSG